LVFDPSGDLWVISFAHDLFEEFTPSQIAATGSPSPAVTVNTSGSPVMGAFDASGDLWITDYTGDTVTEFTPAQLAAGGTPTPNVTITTTSGFASLNEPWGIAFDSSNDLWVANFGGSKLVEYTPGQLSASGTPTPTVILGSSGGSLTQATGIAFDASGDLWATNYNSSVVEFSPSQLASSASPTPVDVITGGSTGLSHNGAVAIAQAPTVTSITPTAGPGNGGTTVTIHGSMFLPGSQVSFGSTPATSATYLSPYVMTAVAPAGTGPVDTTVTDFAGTSATSGADQFTYPGAPPSPPTPPTPPSPPTPPTPTIPATNSTYWEVASDGGILSFGNPYYGSNGGRPLDSPIMGMAPTADGKGYWLVASDGGIFTFGDAGFYGSKGGQHLNAPIVGMAGTADGRGYWEVAGDGGIFTFGDATYYGSEGGKHLNGPVVGMAPTSDGDGYWEVASDGGIFSFGDARFAGSEAGNHLNGPVVGMGT
jgi:hypothetical protein